MSNKVYSFGTSDQGDVRIRNKAKLDDGTVVEYDHCCEAGGDLKFSAKAQTKYLGRGVVYEVCGVKQHEHPMFPVKYHDFWKVISY